MEDKKRSGGSAEHVWLAQGDGKAIEAKVEEELSEDNEYELE